MNTTSKEIYALNRIRDLLGEESYSYLAARNRTFDEAIVRVYRDVSREITRLEHY